MNDIVTNMPKVELHLHLEGAFTFEFLFGLIQKYGGDPAVGSLEYLKKKFIFRDFPHFIETWFWKNRFFRRAEDFEELAYSTLENLHKQNVLYCEVFFSPWDFSENGIAVQEIAEATISGIQRAKQDFGIGCGLIADIVRDYGAETAIHRLDEITPYLNGGIIGMGLGGSEQKFPAHLFEDVFKEAQKRGFHLTAHAGEAAGPDSVWQAIQVLGAERIGHGVRALEDPALIEVLGNRQIPLEICLTSNLKTQVFPTIDAHPFKKFYEEGLMVTVNSDDPPMFGATITDEFRLLQKKLRFDKKDLKKLTENAVNASFLSAADKGGLLEKIGRYWQAIGIQ